MSGPCSPQSDYLLLHSFARVPLVVLYADQMNAESLGRKLLLTPPPHPATPENPGKADCGYSDKSHDMLSYKHFQALSLPALQGEAAWAEEERLGNIPVTTTTKIFQKVRRRRIAIQMGGVLRYKWEEY